VDIQEFYVVGRNTPEFPLYIHTQQGIAKASEMREGGYRRFGGEVWVASARTDSGNGGFLCEGVVRGPQDRCSFQGKVLDAKESYRPPEEPSWPAYGSTGCSASLAVDRRFGNGRDRGLIGITFRLRGKTLSPAAGGHPLVSTAARVFRRSSITGPEV